MSNVHKLFRFAFSTILFCSCTGLLFYSAGLYSGTLKLVSRNYMDKGIYQQYNNTDTDMVLYAELIATLCNKPEYETLINDITINKENFNPEMISKLEIPRTSYRKTYSYDNRGMISKIHYTSLMD